MSSGIWPLKQETFPGLALLAWADRYRAYLEGYRYLFYPGAPYASTEYATKNESLKWVDVFVAIEKKRVALLSGALE